VQLLGTWETPTAAVGFRVKSGWATAVLLSDRAGDPLVIERYRVELSDPDDPHSLQPYHAGTGVAQTDEGVLAQLIEVVHGCARRSVAQHLARHRVAGYQLVGAGIVVWSNTPPDGIANPHIRAHASEGRLFCTALESGLQEWGVAVSIFVERALYPTAARLLGTSEKSVKQAVTTMGKGRVSGWRVDEKAAAVAAWLVLRGKPGGEN
jgi:hypothetical protein